MSDASGSDGFGESVPSIDLNTLTVYATIDDEDIEPGTPLEDRMKAEVVTAIKGAPQAAAGAGSGRLGPFE
ncbi:MAG: hypothetical protein ABGZ35_26395 [Planctomycetaceae bacterium]